MVYANAPITHTQTFGKFFICISDAGTNLMFNETNEGKHAPTSSPHFYFFGGAKRTERTFVTKQTYCPRFNNCFSRNKVDRPVQGMSFVQLIFILAFYIQKIDNVIDQFQVMELPNHNTFQCQQKRHSLISADFHLNSFAHFSSKAFKK